MCSKHAKVHGVEGSPRLPKRGGPDKINTTRAWAHRTGWAQQRGYVEQAMSYETMQRRLKTSAGRLKSRIFWTYREADWRRRALPDFILIGAMKAGTSSLFSYLSQHPQIYPSCTKEVHFFDGGLNPDVDNFKRGQPWYRAHFPVRDKIDLDSKVFEASPLYIFNPLVPKRLFDLVPEVKLIAILRNPTERAISHYFHEKRKGREPLNMITALQEEERRLEPAIMNKYYKSRAFIDYSYKSRGLYKEQIERYLKYFNKQNILVIGSEELFHETESTLHRIFEFVRVDTNFKIEDLSPLNVASNKQEIESTTYDYLNCYFAPHNQSLYELIGRNFAW